MTVFGGPERRRRWSEEERLQILAEAFAPGAFVAQVARRHDVSTALIYTWRRKLCQPVAETGTSLPAEAGFAEAVVVDDQRADQAPSQPAIVIDLARVGRVNIFASAPPALATAVLKAVMR